MKLLSFLFATVPVASYAASTISQPLATPFGVVSRPKLKPKQRLVHTEIVLPKDLTKSHIEGRKTYDLGIGKNQPVYGRKGHGGATMPLRSRGDITQYLNEHLSMREYPSPSQTAASTKRRKTLPKVQPERRTTEFLDIISDRSTSCTVMPIIQPSSDVKLDVNTVWVEMMLHSEQTKLEM